MARHVAVSCCRQSYATGTGTGTKETPQKRGRGEDSTWVLHTILPVLGAKARYLRVVQACSWIDTQGAEDLVG